MRLLRRIQIEIWLYSYQFARQENEATTIYTLGLVRLTAPASYISFLQIFVDDCLISSCQYRILEQLSNRINKPLLANHLVRVLGDLCAVGRLILNVALKFTDLLPSVHERFLSGVISKIGEIVRVIPMPSKSKTV